MEWRRIGFGTWPLAGGHGIAAYGHANDEVSKEALREAYEWGINVYDTSDFYGYGHVESMMGEIFEEDRDDITIITKGGMVSETEQNFDPDYLSSALYKSLDRLRTRYIDIYLLHSPDPSVLKNKKLLSFLNDSVSNGIIKEWGVSLKQPEDGFDLIHTDGPKSIEVNYSLLDRRAEFSGLLDLCQTNGVKVIGRTPLGQGILCGKFTFSDDKADRRNRWKVEYVDKMTAIYKKMLAALNPNTYSDVQNCLRFCLYNKAVSVIIPGMKTMDQVIENIAAEFYPPLTDEEVERITKIYKEEKL